MFKNRFHGKYIKMAVGKQEAENKYKCNSFPDKRKGEKNMSFSIADTSCSGRQMPGEKGGGRLGKVLSIVVNMILVIEIFVLMGFFCYLKYKKRK